MKQFLKMGSVLCALLAGQGVLADEIKLGFVDLQRAVTEIDEGAKARAELKKEFDKKQAILDAKQNEAKLLQDDLQKKGSVMDSKVKQQKTQELQEKVAEVQQLYVGMQQEMMKGEQEKMGGILQRMDTILQAIGTDGEYTLILKKNRVNMLDSPVLFGKPSLDVTNEAIRRYNKAYGKGEKAKKTKSDKK